MFKAGSGIWREVDKYLEKEEVFSDKANTSLEKERNGWTLLLGY